MTENHHSEELMNSKSNRLLTAIDKISEWTGKIFSFLVVVATFQICIELTLRYVFNAPTAWGLEFSIYLCAATYVMAGAYAHRFDAHIKVDVLYNHFSPRVRALVDIFITDLLFFFFCGVLVWQSGMWAWESITRGITSGSIWDPPIWPMRSLLFLGSSILFLQGFAKFLRNLTIVIGKKNA